MTIQTVGLVKGVDRPTQFHVYSVEGTGAFPYSLLMQEKCWPYDPAAAIAMVEDSDRRVKMGSYHYPTLSRWAKYGWEVT
jgi:hypothetical protein